MNDTTQLVTKGERHCGTNLLTEVLKLTFGAASPLVAGYASLQFDWHAEKVPQLGVSPITWVE